jgi:hypothetical protein
MEKNVEAKEAIEDRYIQWTWRIIRNAQTTTKSKSLKIGQWIMSMKNSLFRQDLPSQVFRHARRSIALTKIFPTLTPLRGFTNGNPRTSLAGVHALEAKERKEALLFNSLGWKGGKG